MWGGGKVGRGEEREEEGEKRKREEQLSLIGDLQ